ncbi:cell wall metabolism sensor histidine kinase WalK [Agromyces sp. LHK192]|uniref:sensor histidine kinase n=1 Tax=Agromyces sp. LHK192 TaxID=2498704 RepID=UPI000FD802C1|nr:HAMP domain-containing sensor histidine kinase [Agromyces sp. LHK192]
MSTEAATATPDRGFDVIGSVSRVRTVWIWQLLFAAVVTIIVLAGYLLDPAFLTIEPLIAGVIGVLTTTIAALVTPWARFPESAATIVPYLDIVWVGLLTFSIDLRLSHLWVFPITWLASQFSLARLVAGVGLVGVIAMIEVHANESAAASALRVLITVLALTFVGIAVHVTARQGRAYRTLVGRQAGRVRHSLDTVMVEQRRVRDMLDAVHIGIAQVSAAGELLSSNAAYRALYAIDESDPNRPARSVEYDALRGAALRGAQRTFARATRGEEFENEAVWLFDPDGRWHALSVATRRRHPGAGEQPSTMIIAEDITEVIAAGKRRDALAAVVSHELRNPLTAILGHTDRLLEDTGLDESARKRLVVIEEASDRMMRLIDSILETRPDQATRADRDARAVTDLREILEASLESFTAPSAERGVRVVADYADDLHLFGDAFRLRQLVDNLVGNAIKYTPRGGTVDVTGRAEGDVVVVTVRDTGIGMEPTDVDRVFEPYFRGSAAVDSGIPGTGLGLGIVRHIVDAHAGTIEIASELGSGTLVTVRIPAEAT